MIAEAAARAVGRPLAGARRVAGGDINEASIVELAGGARRRSARRRRARRTPGCGWGRSSCPPERRQTGRRSTPSDRLAPLVRAAEVRAALPHGGRAAIEAVIERLPALAGPPEPPARLHGDLWSGNVLAGDDGRPWLIDPAAERSGDEPSGRGRCGHLEIDLAMVQLFGAFYTRHADRLRRIGATH